MTSKPVSIVILLMLPSMVEIPEGEDNLPKMVSLQTGFTTRYCYDKQFAFLTLNFEKSPVHLNSSTLDFWCKNGS